ncbi:hypothetical protein LXL04_026118 [Taraxacum kok-saghyz]
MRSCSRKQTDMSTGELLSIEPQELQFPFELKKQIACSMQLKNKTDNHVAFKQLQSFEVVDFQIYTDSFISLRFYKGDL